MATTTKNNLAIIQKDTVDIVAKKVREFQERGELSFPANYSPENAMKAAWLIIQETVDSNKAAAIDVCTRNSIANALLNMVVQGLNPAKNQCYFIVYGQKLMMQRSYFGSMHIAKTVNPEIEDIISEIVYKSDLFHLKIVRGKTVVDKHEPDLDGRDKSNIRGAYCSIFYKNGTEQTTYMTFDEIKQSWKQSRMNPIDEKGNVKASSTHGKFTAEMCKKTVTNKACKTIINASDDSSLIIQAYHQTEADIAEAEAHEEIETNANTEYVEVNADTGEVITDGTTAETTESAPGVEVETDDLP